MRWELDGDRLPTGTVVRLSKRADVDVKAILRRLQKAEVPVEYTDQLAEIYFTVLPESPRHVRDGDYVYMECTHIRGPRPRVRLHYKAHRLHKVLTHELGHHVDALDDLSSIDEVVKEYEAHRQQDRELIESGHEKSQVIEYIAGGFEVFYFGNRSRLRETNPILHDAVAAAHRKYAPK